MTYKQHVIKMRELRLEEKAFYIYAAIVAAREIPDNTDSLPEMMTFSVALLHIVPRPTLLARTLARIHRDVAIPRFHLQHKTPCLCNQRRTSRDVHPASPTTASPKNTETNIPTYLHRIVSNAPLYKKSCHWWPRYILSFQRVASL